MRFVLPSRAKFSAAQEQRRRATRRGRTYTLASRFLRERFSDSGVPRSFPKAKPRRCESETPRGLAPLIASSDSIAIITCVGVPAGIEGASPNSNGLERFPRRARALRSKASHSSGWKTASGLIWWSLGGFEACVFQRETVIAFVSGS